tara:strand:- start:2704 stop:3105 length:402 start_codon:yes stop_codon:yes gene_type:complete
MKKLLLLIAVLSLSLTLKAQQDVLQARYVQTYDWNYDTKEYDNKAELWDKISFTYNREFIQIELKPDTISKFWWVAYPEGSTDNIECHITEGDEMKICIDLENNLLAFYFNAMDGVYSSVVILSKIHKIGEVD